MLVVVAVIGTLAGLLLPAVQGARESARRTSCSNNLRQLALAFANYESALKYLPPLKRTKNCVAAPNNEAGMAQRSWAPDALPYLEEGNLIAGYNLSENWWSNAGGVDVSGIGGQAGVLDTNPTGNRALARNHLPVLQCPSAPFPNRIQDKLDNPRKTGACTDYFLVAGTGTSFATVAALPSWPAAALPGPTEEWSGCASSGDARRPRGTLAKITDGLSRTILFAECAGREDVWRDRTRYPANADNAAGASCARAQGGAWATNDNPYAFGERSTGWCATSTGSPTSGDIPRPARVNGSNESGWLVYAFHPGGAHVVMADAAVRLLGESTEVQLVGELATRSGGELSATP